jgi:hypothetical protein
MVVGMAGGGIENIGFDFVQNIIGQLITIVGSIYMAAKWIDKRNQSKMEYIKVEVEKRICVTEKQMLDSIDALKKSGDLVKEYMERDIHRLDNTVESLRLGTGENKSNESRRRYYKEAQ